MFVMLLGTGVTCVAHTAICAPAGSAIQGTVRDDIHGGSVTITPHTPFTALGARFRAGAPTEVDVQPWSGGGEHGAIVHVMGELDGPQIISGARVAGRVRIGQILGTTSRPQLEQARDLQGGQLALFDAGTVDVTPGMRVDGAVDLGGGKLAITSAQPVRALGLELAAGDLQVSRHADGTTITGVLARPQVVGGVKLQDRFGVTLDHGRPRFQYAHLAEATALDRLGLPGGDAPAGTVLAASGWANAPQVTLSAPAAITVCGLAMLATSAAPLAFAPDPPGHGVVMRGTLAQRDVDAGGGAYMSGAIEVRYPSSGCTVRGVAGTLARATEQLHLHFAAGTHLWTGELDGAPAVQGTLGQTETLDGLRVKGVITAHQSATGELHLDAGTLATSAMLGAWRAPAGTKLERHDQTWTFATPRGTTAHAIAAFHGEHIDAVTELQVQGGTLVISTARDQHLHGSGLGFTTIEIEPSTGCVTGSTSHAEHDALFALPNQASLTVCGGALTELGGYFVVPSIRVGRWYATEAIAGEPSSPPPVRGDAVLHPVPPAHPASGYWLQIARLCDAPGGIPHPPPPRRWVWVDRRGEPRTPDDRRELAASASRPGAPCPVVPCCPP